MTVKQELNTVRELVEHILETKPATRNSDTLLYLEACKYMGANTIDDLQRLNLNIITVHKIRQVVQNRDGMYPPDEKIKKERSRRRVEIRDYMKKLQGE